MQLVQRERGIEGVWRSSSIRVIDFGYKTLHRCHAGNTKHFRFSNRSRSPFKNSPFNEKLFANRNTFSLWSLQVVADFHFTKPHLSIKQDRAYIFIYLGRQRWPRAQTSNLRSVKSETVLPTTCHRSDIS